MNAELIRTLQLISVRWWNANAYYAISLTEALNQAGIYSLAGGRGSSPPIKMACQMKLPVYPDIDLESLNIRQIVKNILRLRDLVKRQGISLINAHRPEDHFFAGLVRQKTSSTALIRTIGDVRPPKNNPVNKWLHLSATDFFVFSCAANKKRYQDVWPIPEKKTAVIYAGVDTQEFSPPQGPSALRETLSIAPDTMVFGMVGRLSPVKNHRLFLEAAAIVSGFHSRVAFIISGEEVEISEAELREFACHLGIPEKVHFIGKKSDVREVITAIDVGITCSSDSEAISRITTEFLAMGRPVIVTNVNVLPEMISEGEEGFIVSKGAAAQLADRMKLLVEEPGLFRCLSENARIRAEKDYSLTQFLKKTASVYETVLREKKR